MAHRRYTQFDERKVKDNLPPPSPGTGKVQAPSTPDKQVGWPKHGGGSGPMGGGFPKVKQSNETTL